MSSRSLTPALVLAIALATGVDARAVAARRGLPARQCLVPKPRLRSRHGYRRRRPGATRTCRGSTRAMTTWTRLWSALPRLENGATLPRKNLTRPRPNWQETGGGRFRDASEDSTPWLQRRGRTGRLGRSAEATRAANLAHRGSAERKTASIDAGRSKATVADQANRYQSPDASRIVEGLRLLHPLHLARSGRIHTSLELRQRNADPAGARIRDDPPRKDPRGPHHPAGRTPACRNRHSRLPGRLAWPF